MSKTTDFLSNAISLRESLKQSLELLDSLITKTDLIGNSTIEKKIEVIKNKCLLFEEFERSFPSICFSIATGIGKIRLMGAFVTYGGDYETKGIKASDDTIQINMFNIGKINADIKTTTKDGRTLPPKRYK